MKCSLEDILRSASLPLDTFRGVGVMRPHTFPMTTSCMDTLQEFIGRHRRVASKGLS